MKKRIFSAFLAMTVAVSGFAMCVSAQEPGGNTVDVSYDFYNDFEEYNNEYENIKIWRKQTTEAVNATGQYLVDMPYIGGNSDFNANAAWSIAILSDDTNPFFTENHYPEDIDPEQHYAPASALFNSGNKTGYTELDPGKFEFGGLSDGTDGIGYIGYLSNITLKYSSDNQDVESLMVVGDSNKELALAPYNMGTYKLNSKSFDTAYFGHVADVADRNTVMTAKIRLTDSGENLKLHLVQNGQWSNLKTLIPTIANGMLQYAGNYDKGNWYDAVSFADGSIYLGNEYVGTYDSGATYTIEYYLDFNGTTDSTHTLVIKDEDGAVVVASDKYVIGFEQSMLGYNTATAAYLTPYKNHGQITSAGENDEYALVFSNSAGKVYIDDFGFGTAAPLTCTTDADYYISNPIRFLDSPSIEIGFNYDIISENVAELVSAKTADGTAVPCTAKVSEQDSKVLEVVFGTLDAASNYIVTISEGMDSRMFTLEDDISINVRTMDNLTIGTPVVADTGSGLCSLFVDITNASADTLDFVVVVAVKKSGNMSDGKLYYKAGRLITNTSATVTVENIAYAGGDSYIETYYIDSFGTLRALSDSKINY